MSSDERLVWADQLLERGDPRGELITTQVALARGDLPRDDSVRLRRLEQDLLAKVPGLDGLADEWTWTLGAIEEITIGADAFLERRAALFEHAPFLRRLRLHGLPDTVGAATAMLERILDDERIDGLVLGTKMDPVLLVELGASGHLQRLRSLEASGLSLARAIQDDALANVDDLVLTSLWELFSAHVHEPSNVRPRRLRLQSQSQQRSTWRLPWLGPPTLFSRVEDLELDWFIRADAEVDIPPELLRRLRRLRLPMGVAEKPLSLATGAAHLDNLQELEISFFGNETEIDFRALMTGEHFEKLRVLRIGPGLTTVDDLLELVQSPLARTLEVLDVSRNRWRLDVEDLGWDGVLFV